MNEADDADVTCELLLGIAINAARAPIKRLMPNGTCYNCQLGLSHTGAFCNANCRDDWQDRERINNGRL
jgi:hypothetical protein